MSALNKTGEHKRIAIIGGGFTGLAAATILRQKSARAEITVFEKADRLGGLATGFREPGWQSSVENLYHHWFSGDALVLSFLKAWGLERNIFFKAVPTVVETREHGFATLDSPMALLRYPELNLPSKLRLCLALAYLRSTRSWQELEKITAFDWCQKWMGVAAFEAIWRPLLEGKFGAKFAPTVNMAWLWARLATRTKKLGSYQGGFLKLTEDIAQTLTARGISIRSNCGDLKWTDVSDFDAILIAASPATLQSIAGDIVPAAFLDDNLSRPCLAARCFLFSMKRPLNRDKPYYWYNLRKNKKQPFLALIEHTNFVDPSQFCGEHLVYIASYIDPMSEEWTWPDSIWEERALKVFRKIAPDFTSADILRKWSFSVPYAQPIAQINASKQLPPIRVPGCRNLYFASMAHVYPWDRGTNYALELGQKAADIIATDLALLT